jgi:hypothetical protein
MRILKSTFYAMMVILSAASSVVHATDRPDLKFAGALEFSDNGTLFVGDNINGAIYAFDMSANKAPEKVSPVKVFDIDVRIGNLLGVGSNAIEINDMAVHPVSREIFISVSRIDNHASKPAVIKVALDGQVEVLDLASYSHSKQALANYPDQETTFKPRGLMGMPPTAKDLAKGDVKLSSLAIMDMLFHDDQLYVAGVAYDDFLSTMRKIPFPFNGTQSTTSVETYHIAHDQYETRAPIRAMSIQNIDGKEQLIAAYTCSPVVLIPLDEIVDGKKIAAKTIGDMGNGQPIDMIPYTLNGQSLLFVTNNSRSPQVIPLSGLNGAKVVDDKDFERGPKLDLGPVLPFGPMGEMVMFEGVSLHLDLLSDEFFVSVTRDIKTGGLNLDSNFTFFPNRVHNLVAEYDFPQYYTDKAE